LPSRLEVSPKKTRDKKEMAGAKTLQEPPSKETSGRVRQERRVAPYEASSRRKGAVQIQRLKVCLNTPAADDADGGKKRGGRGVRGKEGSGARMP